MKRRPRIRYTDSQKALMWDRWQKGDSMHEITRLFDRSHPSIQRILTENGGFRPRQRKLSSRRSLINPESFRVSCINHCPGTGAQRCPTINGSRLRQIYRCTSAIQKVHGSADRMRTPTVSLGSTSQKGLTCLSIRRQSWIGWQDS